MVNPKRGGARKGAGRKPLSANSRKYLLLIDDADLERAKRLGNGVIAAGIRFALRQASNDPPKG